jgi:hypothetical protein
MKTFRYHDQDLELFDHPYNGTITNERALEIPIARDFLKRTVSRASQTVLEAGDVLAHYADVLHWPERLVVDRYERAPGVLNEDVFGINGPWDVIVSISTVEHVRWDELGLYRNPCGALAALHFLRGMLNPGGSMLATWPWGYARGELDRWLDHFAQTHSADEWVTYVREEGEWEVDWPEGHDVGLAVVEFSA